MIIKNMLSSLTGSSITLLALLFCNFCICSHESHGFASNDEIIVEETADKKFKISFTTLNNQQIHLIAQQKDGLFHESESSLVILESSNPGIAQNAFPGMHTEALSVSNEYEKNFLFLTAEKYSIFNEASKSITEHKGIIELTAENDKNGKWNISGKIIPDDSDVDDFIEIEYENSQRKIMAEEQPMPKISCGTDTKRLVVNDSNAVKKSPVVNSFMMASRMNKTPDNFKEGCPIERKVIYVGVVADCSYVATFSSIEECKQEIIRQFALVSAIYERSFNISLVILSITIMKDCSTSTSSTPFNQYCTEAYEISQRLSDFSKWRASQTKNAGIYHLMTACNTSSVYGVAWLDQACNSGSSRDLHGSWISGTSVSAKSKYHFSTIAHEIGHNLGANHDCNSDICSIVDRPSDSCVPCGASCDCKGKFIMSPDSSGRYLTNFSLGTIQDICRLLIFKQKCLFKPGTFKSVTGPICGDGIKEGDEECDCGDAESCARDPCCGTDCKLKPGANCSDANDTCCRQCQIISRDERKICYFGSGPCMENSYCDGVSAACPTIPLVKNGTPCTNVKVVETDFDSPMCASGFCTSKDIQCRSMGSGGIDSFSGVCSGQSTSCVMQCKKGNECYSYNVFFIDGTKCGRKGYCKGGVCIGASALDYVDDYWEIIIVLGLMFISVILFIIFLAIKMIRIRRRQEAEEEERVRGMMQHFPITVNDEN